MSTIDALITIVEEVRQYCNSKTKMIQSTFIEFKQAFNTADHAALHEKCDTMGSVLNFLKSH